MNKAETQEPFKKRKQRYFAAKELQLSIAVLAVIALLAGIFLHTVSSSLMGYYGVSSPVLGVFLVAGYVVIVAILSMYFANRLVGPFKRLEYEMKLIAAGELSRKLSVRAKDDLHIRHFVRYVNKFLGQFEEMSSEYNRLNSVITTKLSEFDRELSKEKFDCNKIKEEIKTLQKAVHGLREKR